MTSAGASEYIYVDTATGGPQHRNHVMRADTLRLPADAADCYTTYFRYPADFAEYAQRNRKPSVKGYAGPVWTDRLPIEFDCEADPARALQDAGTLIRQLEAVFDVPRDAPRCYFSGHKGVHIEIPGALFGGIEPSVDLPARFKRLATVLTDRLSTADLTVYDRVRLWRVPNTRHSKTRLFKIPITSRELLSGDLATIRDLARHPRNLVLPNVDDWQPVPALIDAWHATATHPASAAPPPHYIPPINGRVPVDALLERALGKAALNSRNDTGFWLACQLRDNGYAESEANGVIRKYVEHAPAKNHAYGLDEALASVQQAYTQPAREPWSSPSTNGSEPVKAERPAQATTLQEVIATFQRWLYMPDPGMLEVDLAAVVANKAPGDPLWILDVVPPGGGKTEILAALAADPLVHPVGTLTEAALLSGVSRKDRHKDATGGLLRQIGGLGILCPKDFGSVLSMNRDSRAQVLAALREVFDGYWVRHVGADGGRKLEWRGKCGFIGGSTPAIDQHHAVLAILGERFLYYRGLGGGRPERARKAIRHAGDEARMRHELAESVAGLLGSVTTPTEATPLTAAEEDQLIALTDFATVCRAPVYRDPYRREIEDVPGPEMPTRMAIALRLLLGGLVAIGVDAERCWTLIRRVALDSMPLARRNVLAVLFPCREELETHDIATHLGYPTVTARRALEDLACYGAVERLPGKGKSDRWAVTAWTLHTSEAASFSEIPACVYTQ